MSQPHLDFFKGLMPSNCSQTEIVECQIKASQCHYTLLLMYISSLTSYFSYYMSQVDCLPPTERQKTITSSSTAHISVQSADTQKEHGFLDLACSQKYQMLSVVFGWACLLWLPPQKGMANCDTTSGGAREPPALPHLCLESGNSFPGSLVGALLQRIDRSLQERLWFLSDEHLSQLKTIYNKEGLFPGATKAEIERYRVCVCERKGEESHPFPLSCALHCCPWK